MLTGEIHRVDSIAGPDGLVSMRFEQIVEELHVKLVVLNDQDFLGHPPPLLGIHPPAPFLFTALRFASPLGVRSGIMKVPR